MSGLPQGTPSPCPGLGWDCASGEGRAGKERVLSPAGLTAQSIPAGLWTPSPLTCPTMSVPGTAQRLYSQDPSWVICEGLSHLHGRRQQSDFNGLTEPGRTGL